MRPLKFALGLATAFFIACDGTGAPFAPDGPIEIGSSFSAASAPECVTISFDDQGFSHGSIVTSLTTGFGFALTVEVLNDPNGVNTARIYDTQLQGGPDPDLEVPPGDCADCVGLSNVMVIEGRPRWDVEGDSPDGGNIRLTGFAGNGPFYVESYKALDQEPPPRELAITLSVDGTLIGSSTGQGNGSVETVLTDPTTFENVAEFGFDGSGAVDDLVICREGVCDAAIGDFVWSDDNGNGIQDAGEPGIPGVTVKLLMGGDVVATTTTDANGFYLFSGLCPGTYEVEFVAPENFEFTNPNVGGDDTVDSDADPVTGRTGPIDLDDGETDLTWDAGFAPCAPCKGGVTSVTLELLTGGTPFFDVGSDETVEDLGDDTYRISGPLKGDGTLDKLSDFEIFVNGELDSKIHTSCSQPVDPGLIYGSFLIVASSSKDNGPICPLGDCSFDLLEQKLSGNKFEWKIENTGISSLVLKSIDINWPSAFGNLKKIELNGTIYEGPVAGPSLSLMEGDFLGIPKNRWIKPGDDDVLKFEWQDDISSSADFSITVVFYGSDNETCILEFTGEEEPGDGGLSCADGKPQVLVMEYTGANCTDNPPNDNPFAGPPCNTQDEGKITVTGSPTGVVPNVWYKAGKKSDPSDGDADQWGMGQVTDGTLSIDATLGGDSKLASDTWVHLYSDAGYTTVFQSIRFHTSCSQPLEVGDQFGSLLLAEYFPEP